MATYNESNIKVLKGLDPVRKRPGMYIGSTDSRGLHHLIWEIFDNAVDEVLAGVANIIEIIYERDGSIIIKDNGRGIPTGINKSTGISSVETVFTVLHAGGKFDETAYKVSGGLHGVGASVVNALSEWLVVRVNRGGKVYEARFEHGGAIAKPLHEIAKTNRTGTYIHFKPDKKIFKNAKFNVSTIKERIRESSFLFEGLKITFEDKLNRTYDEFVANDGIAEYVAFINENRTTISPIARFESKHNDVEVAIALQYTNDMNEIIISFANSVKTYEGGSHETGFKIALTETINDYARKWKLLKERDKNLDGSDIREGLAAVISVKIPEHLITYEGQTKNKLYTPEAREAVKKVLNEKLSFWFEENKIKGQDIIKKALLARDARNAARKARDAVRKTKGKKVEKILSGKLTPAQSKDPRVRELFLVEGDSAGGSAKLGRNKVNQAILPLKGKVINVEKAKLLDVLRNEEIGTIITCLGTGISKEFDLKKLKYNKIIIMTDADTDGAHIQVLLLTMFYRFFKPLVEAGHIYIAMPPLYKITYKKTKEYAYAWDENTIEDLKKGKGAYEIQRYKGLGEMNAEQLWDTTMNPETRQLIRVQIDDLAIAERQVSVLMGDNVAKRKTWINANVDFTLED